MTARWKAFLVAGVLVPCALQAADVREGLVSYWPLDEMNFDTLTTPDVVSGNDFNLGNMAPSDIVPGKFGNAFNFTPDYLTYLWFTTPTNRDTGLPISMHPEWTVMFWVNANVVGTDQSDRRVFSESSSMDGNNHPLVNLGTQNAGTITDPSIYLYMRIAGAPTLNHVHSALPVFDGQWHHVALTYTNEQLHLYIDGQEDPNSPWDWPRGNESRDTTSIGAIVREQGQNVGSYFAGKVDEVAVWERALNVDEIRNVMTNGIQTPVPAFAPVITLQPQGATNLITGDAFTLRVSASGTRPLQFQWFKDGSSIAGATNSVLSFDSLTPADSGTYTVRVSNAAGSIESEPAMLQISDWPAPDLERGMLCYWPMEEIVGSKTPDKRSWYDMELVNLRPEDLVQGRWGKCFQFDSSRRTMLVYMSSPDDELPIYKHDNFTVSLWVKGDIQQDLRVFSEGSTASTQPLFNIGTHNQAVDGTVDIYIRDDNGGTANHRHSVGIAFDNNWHHIVYVQRTIGNQLKAWLYIDGQLDPVEPAPRRPLTLNTTTIGGILRANPSHWFTGLIDDVALWTRALSPEEIQLLYLNGTPMPKPRLRPLVIRSFKSSLPAVKRGDTVRLSWDVSADATSITITPDVGDVTAQTTAGVGSIDVPVTKPTTFTLTITRGDESLTAQVHVGVVDGIADNWTLIDNFDQYTPGPLGETGWWMDLRGGATIEEVDGNMMLRVVGGDGAVILPLGPLTLKEGESRTLFFRVQTLGDTNLAIRHIVGLTDKSIRWYGDANGDVGPHITFWNDSPDYPGLLVIGTHNGVGSAEEFNSYSLEPNTLYNIWIDVQNRSLEEGDLFSVYIQKVGDPQRITLFSNYLSDRNPEGSVDLGPTLPDLDKLFIATQQPDNSLLFDDFYISQSGLESTVPREPGFTGMVEVQIAIRRQGDQIVLTWNRGTLESAPSITGPWTPLPEATPPYTVTPTQTQQFYRVRVQ